MNWSIFDIVGPVMIGPSSSHTSGAVRLGLFARYLIGGLPTKADIYLHGSYAQVYKGHGTDIALVAGLLGHSPDDENAINSLEEAKKLKLQYSFHLTDLGADYHPNTAKFELRRDDEKLEVIGESIGAGNIQIVEINKIRTNCIDGKYRAIIVSQLDKPGIIASVSDILSTKKINIAQMTVSRNGRGKEALSVLNIDNGVSQEIMEAIERVPAVNWAKLLPKLT
ncbi:L-serine ammonia-lyase, iron-sulfur-dependent, subunit beta [Candidatus Dojkabacteria bacterium]|nr:L-serine ammonia-lyase, iron-sulfur-dependent, subunit beta [Candidatus Dojkabacteria bacterium]